jgi:acyl carrier protein
MKIENKIEQIIFKIIDDKNKELNLHIKKKLNTCIIGEGSDLDSLGVFSFVLDLEKTIEEEFEIELSLINDEFLNNQSDHMSNVEKLKSFIIQKLKSNNA